MKRRVLLSLAAGCGMVQAALAWLAPDRTAHAEHEDYRTVAAQRGTFRKIVRRVGVLKPVDEQRIVSKLNGTILEIAAQGKSVQKGDIVLKVDPAPYEDQKVSHEASIAQIQAEFKRNIQEAEKQLNKAREDVSSYDLRVELETMRVEDLKKGPTATDAINARVNLENSRNLLQATEEELQVLQLLADSGFVSKEEIRQKRLEANQQKLKVAEADIAQRKLYISDPVKIAEQELKQRDAIKTRDTARERVALLERNLQRDRENHARRMEREEKRLQDLIENIEKTVYRAPAAGIVVHRKSRWYDYAPGRDVGDGGEIMALPDFSKMKVALTVDEARIANVSAGQPAEVVPAGWRGAPLRGKVTRVADKGRDEFEQYAEQTTGIIGTANRQVFDVEIEVDGQSRSFRPGLRASVEIVLQTLENVILVPRAALVRELDGQAFVRVNAGGGVERRGVKVLGQNELSVAVEGVRDGERVWIVANP